MTSAAPAHVVFIEPSGPHTEHLRQLLQFEGLDVSACAADDVSGLTRLPPHLLVLNHSRLRGSTLAVAHTFTLRGESQPLTLALVARGDELRGIELVERGVDGYVALPCGSREFVARVRAMLRRTAIQRTLRPGGLDAGIVRMRDLDVDPARRRVRASGRDLRLTEQEFRLLYFLAGHAGRVFDRQALLDAVWGTETFVTSRSVDALVKRLRHQLRPALRDAVIVETVRGVGYRLTERRAVSPVPAA